MNKPADFDTAQGLNESLPKGGYVCRIMNVEETVSQSKGEPMIKVSLDIAEGPYKDYFTKKYRADNRIDKKWSGNAVANQLVYDQNDTNTTNKGFKTFITSVEESNNGFKVEWGNAFCSCLKNKIVGVIFRSEQFLGDNGISLATKVYSFRSAETIRQGKYKIPDDKLLENTRRNYGAPAVQNAGGMPADPVNSVALNPSDFEEIIPESDLPF